MNNPMMPDRILVATDTDSADNRLQVRSDKVSADDSYVSVSAEVADKWLLLALIWNFKDLPVRSVQQATAFNLAAMLRVEPIEFHWTLKFTGIEPKRIN